MRRAEWFLHWYLESRILFGYSRRDAFNKAIELTKAKIEREKQ